MSRTSFNWADGVLPLEPVGLSIGPFTLDIATTGETDKGGVHRFQLLCQIYAATVLSILISGWEQAYHIDGYRSCFTACKGKPCGSIIACGGQFATVLLPFIIKDC